MDSNPCRCIVEATEDCETFEKVKGIGPFPGAASTYLGKED